MPSVRVRASRSYRRKMSVCIVQVLQEIVNAAGARLVPWIPISCGNRDHYNARGSGPLGSWPSGGILMRWFGAGSQAKTDETFEVDLPEDEWRRRLTPEQ